MGDYAIRNCLQEEFKKLHLHADGYGYPPDQFGLHIELFYESTLICSTFVNMFDENIQK